MIDEIGKIYENVFRFTSTDNLKPLSELNYLDTVEDEPSENDFNFPDFGNSPTQKVPTFSIKLFTKIIEADSIKTIHYSKLNQLIDEVIDRYVEIGVFNDTPISRYDDVRKISARIFGSLNVIAAKSRLGPGNYVLLPEDIYNKMIPFISSSVTNYIINPSKKHSDKIICLRIDANLLNHGVLVVTDSDICNHRRIKLQTIIKKIDPSYKWDINIKYSIVDLGTKCKNTINIIKIDD